MAAKNLETCSKYFCTLLLLLYFFIQSTVSFRQFPVCIEREHKFEELDTLGRFGYIFDYYKNENTYIPVWHGETSPAGLITKFALSSVNIDDKDTDYKDVLKNWVHIDIEAEAELEGLYVQAISAPWGIPFGEFISSFDCIDCDIKTSVYESIINIVPCTKRAALSFEHPTVFTMGGRVLHGEDAAKKRVFFNRVHFHFRYTQYPGVDHTFAQFLVIAVRNFKGNHSRFESFYSPIYQLDVIENKIGAFYPFYAGWDISYIRCHREPPGPDFKLYDRASKNLKIKFNQNFDNCLLNTEDENLKWLTCPPGPINLLPNEIPRNVSEWRMMRQSYGLQNDPSLNTAYGDNAQFCPDAGTSDWTVGELSWKLPDDVVTINEDGVTVALNETYDIELPTVDLDGYVCEEFESRVACNKATNKDHECEDYHINNCKALNITPTFGKDMKTGNYALQLIPCKNLTFVEQIDAIGVGWGHKWVLFLHGKLMIFTWTVAFNVIAFTARFMKEYTVIEKRSSYFGIGKWLWHHIGWTYVAWTSMLSGVYLVAHHHRSDRKLIGEHNDTVENNYHDLCNVHRTYSETKTCLSFERKIHSALGMATSIIFFLSYVSGWARPLNKLLRILLIIYHNVSAYLAKFIFFVVIAVGYLRKTNPVISEWNTVLGVIVLEAMSILMFIVATAYNMYIDKKFAVGKRMFSPFPEGVDTYAFPPQMQRISNLILPVHITIQVLCYFIFIMKYLAPDLCVLENKY